MFRGTVHRFIPDKISKGGCKTSISTQSEVEDIRIAFNCYVHYGRWRRSVQAIPTGLSVQANTAKTPALHNYAMYNTSNYNETPQSFILSHCVDNGSPPLHSIVNHTLATVPKSVSQAPGSTDAFVPATFSTVKQRVFIAWAGSNNFIYDLATVRTAPASPITTYDIGVDAPPTAMTYQLLGGGTTTWTGQGPRYAYAYYDPETGHCSNISPITSITEADQTNVEIKLENLVPPTSAEDKIRFHAIQLFSNSLGNSDEPLSPYGPPLDMALWAMGPFFILDTIVDHDSNLFNGDPNIRTPDQLWNLKPPPFAHMAYWNSQVWGIPVNDPSSVRYSLQPSQPNLGIPEECFPSGNTLRLGADDGRGTGLHVVGNLLVVTTERYSYYITGSTDGTYTLTRFASGTYGVGTYQTDEIAGDTGDNSAAMLYIGRDGTVYILAPGYGNVSLSDPVAIDIATGVFEGGYDNARIVNVAMSSRRMVLVAANGLIYQYDFDRKIWTYQAPDSGGVPIAAESFETVFGTTHGSSLVYIGYHGAIYSLMDPNATTGGVGSYNAYVQTPPLSYSRKSLKRLNFVRLYVSNYTQGSPWVVLITINESTSYAVNAVPHPDVLDDMQPPGLFHVDLDTSAELVAFPAAGGNITDGYRFDIKVMFPSDGNLYDLYAFDVGITDLIPPEDVSP